ncbi:hypothetical protein KIL84_000076 [Mauremys mutica]|nr:hypothetical protein KIL84_000076 [Mauremys mutica]
MHSWMRAQLAVYHAQTISTPRELNTTSLQSGSIGGKESNALSTFRSPLQHLSPCLPDHRSWTRLTGYSLAHPELLQLSTSVAWFRPPCCDCEVVLQTITHVVEECPTQHLEGDLQRLASLDTEAMLWSRNLDIELSCLCTREEKKRFVQINAPSSGRFTMSDRKAVIKNADMSEDMQQDAVDCATQAMEKYNIEKDIAAYIKKEFDKKYNPTWHCIVGRNFGSYVTHETKHFIYFYLGQVAILLFKSG